MEEVRILVAARCEHRNSKFFRGYAHRAGGKSAATALRFVGSCDNGNYILTAIDEIAKNARGELRRSEERDPKA
jgi:hypothetical protein